MLGNKNNIRLNKIMKINDLYGYKLCYKEHKNKLTVHIVTNSYWLANEEMKYCKKYKQYSRKDNHLLINATWYVLPVRNKKEYKKLWKGCPF